MHLYIASVGNKTELCNNKYKFNLIKYTYT